jgi:hypothetical protein
MKYLKKINELFDTEDLKAKHEIPYLTGVLNGSEVLKWEKIITKNNFLFTLVESCPFLTELGVNISGNIINIGFQNFKKYNEKDEVFYYFNIEIIKYVDSYGLNVNYVCYSNKQKIKEGNIRDINLDFIKLTKILNSKVFDELIEFNKFIEKMFGFKHFSNLRLINPRMN